MAQTRLGQLVISFTKRNARRRGPTSSYSWNDTFDELSRDLSQLYIEWNQFLQPLTSTIPDGTDDSNVDAFSDGLDGRTVYANSAATSSSNSTYFSVANERPNTVFEQLSALYTYVDSINTTLSNDISGKVFSASNITIIDSGELYTSANVETALEEVMNSLSAVITASVSYLPLTGETMLGPVNLGNYNIVNLSGLAIGVSSLTANVALQVDSVVGAILLPRMTTTQRNGITAINAMLIYNTTTNKFQGYANGSWDDLN